MATPPEKTVAKSTKAQGKQLAVKLPLTYIAAIAPMTALLATAEKLLDDVDGSALPNDEWKSTAKDWKAAIEGVPEIQWG